MRPYFIDEGTSGVMTNKMRSSQDFQHDAHSGLLQSFHSVQMISEQCLTNNFGSIFTKCI